MAKGRIPNVMDQPGALQDITDITFRLKIKSILRIMFQNVRADILSQRFGYGRYLQGMGQSGTDKITFIQRKHLCLILKPAKRRTSDNAVIILFKFTAQIGAFLLTAFLIASDPLR